MGSDVYIIIIKILRLIRMPNSSRVIIYKTKAQHRVFPLEWNGLGNSQGHFVLSRLKVTISKGLEWIFDVNVLEGVNGTYGVGVKLNCLSWRGLLNTYCRSTSHAVELVHETLLINASFSKINIIHDHEYIPEPDRWIYRHIHTNKWRCFHSIRRWKR